MADEEIGTGQECSCEAEEAKPVEETVETAETEESGGEEPAQQE